MGVTDKEAATTAASATHRYQLADDSRPWHIPIVAARTLLIAGIALLLAEHRAFALDAQAEMSDASVDGDSCVPRRCYPEQKTITVSGECDPYCANRQTAGGAFRCLGFVGTIPYDGYCVPRCLVPADAGGSTCVNCQRCSVGTGECFDDDTGTTCDATNPVDPEPETGADTEPVVLPDGEPSADDGIDILTDDASVDAVVGDVRGDAGSEEPTLRDSCGCTQPRTAEAPIALLVAMGSAVALGTRRTRR